MYMLEFTSAKNKSEITNNLHLQTIIKKNSLDIIISSTECWGFPSL